RGGRGDLVVSQVQRLLVDVVVQPLVVEVTGRRGAGYQQRQDGRGPLEQAASAAGAGAVPAVPLAGAPGALLAVASGAGGVLVRGRVGPVVVTERSPRGVLGHCRRPPHPWHSSGREAGPSCVLLDA